MIGLANGVWDLFHDGHRHLLAEAATRCDELVVCINDDASVRRLKGDGRPVDGLHVRAGNILRFLPRVRWYQFDTDDQLRGIIAYIKPHVIFKGSDYEGKEVVGSDLARVVLIPRLPGYSTTTEIEKRNGIRSGQ